MKKIITLLIGMILFVGCSKSPTMTMASYNDIFLGASIEEVYSMAGNPYEVRELSEEDTEYLYIERLRIAPDVYQHREYTLIFSEGTLIDKTFEEENLYWDFMLPMAR